MRRLLAGLLSYRDRAQRDAELRMEIEHHLAAAAEEMERSGMSTAEAKRQARLSFGGVQQVHETHRLLRGFGPLDAALQNVRFALRVLRRERVFSAVAVLILALGIGANALVFTLVNHVLLRPLPLAAPEQLVRLAPAVTKCGASCATYSTDAVEQLQQRTRVYSDVTGYDAFTAPGNYKLTGKGAPLPVSGVDVMRNFFRTLGVQPMLGRDFLPSETVLNARPVVMVSYAFWKEQLHGDPGIVGEAIDLSQTPTTVIGVLPPTFDFGSLYAPGTRMDLFTPYIPDRVREYGNMLAVTARMRPGVTRAQAQAEADFLFPQLPFSVKQGFHGNYSAQVRDLKEYITGSLHRALFVLWCAVGTLLLLVCVNLSNLLLARTSARGKEFALRSALGASRWRVFGQLLTESLLLSAAGGTLGLGLAVAGVWLMAHQSSLALPMLHGLRVDTATLLWTVAIGAASTLAFGLLPAVQIMSGNLQGSLKDSGISSTPSARLEKMRRILAAAQIAIACVLLVAAGLLLRSFLHVLDVELGFEPAHASAITLEVAAPGNNPSSPAYAAALRDTLAHVMVLPGVEAAGITDSLPMGRNRSWGISAKGKVYRPNELPGTFVYVVTPGYLRAIGARLLAGRDLQWTDTDPKQGAVVVNQTVANYLWPNQDPVGRMAEINGGEARVVGVVEDVRETTAELRPGWQMYVSVTAPQYGADDLSLVVRSRLAARDLQAGVLATLRQLNPGQPVAELRPVQMLVDQASSPRRFLVYLVGAFSVLALVLASLGVYGVVAYSVLQRSKEIGVRMALGATRSGVQLGILRQTVLLAAAGVATGLLVAVGVSYLIRALLFGTEPVDPLVYVSIAVMLVLVAACAGYMPARRASRINPLQALRVN